MGIFSWLFGKNEKLPFRKVVRFDRYKSKIKLQKGDKVNIWNQPKTNKINIYSKESYGGEGLIGSTVNSTITNFLKSRKNLLIENTVVNVTNNSIDLLINVSIDNKIVNRNEDDFKNEWINTLNKKYNPRTSWNIRFYSENEIKDDNLDIKTIKQNQIEEYYSKRDQAIWLVDKNNNKINAKSQIGVIEESKTLRAVFSGHQLEIIKFKSDHNYFYFEIGVKK